MEKAIYLAFLIGGIVLFALGNNELHSLSSDLSRMFTGAPTDHAVFLMSGGAVMSLIGTGGIFGLFSGVKN